MQLPDKEVWVVDDDLSMCDFLRSFLTGRGYRLVTIASAEKAVRRYQTERPAAVLLDVMMPGPVDGFEALAAFKNIDRTVPVIVVSGQGRTATVVQAMKLGAADFVCKPFDVQDLEIPLANALRQRQPSCEVASMRDQIQAQSQYHKSLSKISEDTMRLFIEYNWPGNIRELEDLIKRAVVLGDEAAIRKDMTHGLATAAHRVAVAAAPESGHYSLKDISRTAAREAEREWILKILQQTRWNRKETAERLGISYKTLLYKIKEGGLDKAS